MFCYFMSQLVRPMRIPALALAAMTIWRVTNWHAYALFSTSSQGLVMLALYGNPQQSAPEVFGAPVQHVGILGGYV